jgi:glutamate mutase epsilon subunit
LFQLPHLSGCEHFFLIQLCTLSVIRFPDIGAATLEKIIKYLHYKDKYSNSTARIPEFQIDPDEVSVMRHLKMHVYTNDNVL